MLFRRRVRHVLVSALIAVAHAAGEASAETPTSTQDSVCLIIESAALSYGLPFEFFARLIWQESRFNANAVGPVTRSGERARGIAQFMPGTAAERQLLDPLNPVEALPKSAEFLKELHEEFGNLGLAAAAYNAGPRRVREWLDGTGYMPSETRDYVAAITGLTVDDWAELRRKPGAKAPARASAGCAELIALLKQAPTPFIDGLERRVAAVALKPWGVQLAAGFSRSGALAAYGRTTRKFERILSGHDPSILAASLRSRGRRAFYQVRVGADSRGEADALCAKLRAAGGACIVLRNRGRPG